MRKNVLKVSVASFFFVGIGVYGQKKDTTAAERKIDEVIVVGYGKSTKAKLTDNVAKISSESIKEIPNANFQNAIVGKAAGVRVNQTNGKLESGFNINVRGSASISAGTSPLYVIDGIPMINSDESTNGAPVNPLVTLSATEIESIEILKDASSAAIYGSRGSNGVILITTKTGKKGKPKLSLNLSQGFSSPTNKVKFLNAKQYVELFLEAGRNVGRENSVITRLNRYSNNTDWRNGTLDTDWQDYIFQKGSVRDADFTVSGGDDKYNYMFTASNNDTKGIIRKNDLDRNTARLNVSANPTEKLKLGLNLGFSRTSIDRVANDNQFTTPMQAIALAPISPAFVDGEPFDGTTYANFLLEDKYANYNTLIKRITGKIFGEYKILKNLTFNSDFGYDYYNQKEKEFRGKKTPFMSTDGYAYNSWVDTENIVFSNYLSYILKINAHSFSAVAGTELNKNRREYGSVTGIRFPSDDFQNIDSAGEINAGGGNTTEYSFFSYFARANYSYLGKYLLTVTVRADGESNFHPDYRWGYFPSVSAGWRFSDEEFMKPLSSILSNGKLRASYGQTGNSNIGNYMTDSYGVVSGWVFGNDGYMGTAITKRGNKKLTWETTSEFNIGLDLGFFDNRISLSMEYYNRIISDLLVSNKSLPAYNEINTIAANIGKTQGRGFELTLSTVNIMNKDWTWSTDFTFYTFKDNWYERDPNWKPAAYESKKDPIRSYYSYVSDGLLQVGEKAPAWQPTLVPGQIKLKNLYDTGTSPNVLDQYDKVNLGSQDPKCTLGLNNTLRYKNLDFNIYFYGEIGRLRGASYYDAWIVGLGNSLTNVSQQSLHSYTNANQNTTVPNLIESAYDFGDYYHKKINYLRCRNITLGYTIPVSKSIANSVRISANVSNPFVFTNWNGVDPETDTGNFSYPNVTSFSFGIDISF